MARASLIPSGISTEMLSTPLLTVRGRVCSEGEDIHSSCDPIGWYCIISCQKGEKKQKITYRYFAVFLFYNEGIRFNGLYFRIV